MTNNSRLFAILIPLSLAASVAFAHAGSFDELQKLKPSISGKPFTPIPPTGPVPPAEEVRKVYDPDCKRPKDHDEADLCIQREMQYAATSSVRSANLQTFIGALGLLGVLGSLALSAWAAILSRRSADASRESVKVARRAFENDQRAWLTVEATANQCCFDDEDKLDAGAMFVVKNVGKSPARNVNRHILAVDITNSCLRYADTSMGHMIDLYYEIYKGWVDSPVSYSSNIVSLMPGETKSKFGMRQRFEMPSRGDSYWLFYGVTYNDGVSSERKLTASLIALRRAHLPERPDSHVFEGFEHGDFASAAVAI